MTKRIDIPIYYLAAGTLGLALTISLVINIFGLFKAQPVSAAPITQLTRVTKAVNAHFGTAYDWYCQVQNVPHRTVICRSQPNGYYSARYYIRKDGTPVLETYIPPPS